MYIRKKISIKDNFLILVNHFPILENEFLISQIRISNIRKVFFKGHMQREKIFSKFDFIWKIYVNK